MRYCEFCATELPDHASFCGYCGRAPINSAEALTGVSEYPTAGLNNTPGTDEDEEEKRRRAAVIGFGLPLLADSMAQAPGEHVAMVHGTPEIGGVPSVQGTPQTAQMPDFSHRTHGTQPSTSPQHATQPQDISSQSTRHLHTSHRKRQAPGKMIRAGLVTITAVTLIAASIIGAGFTILSPALSLSGSTNVAWGQTIHVHGSHFIPGSSVVLTLDGTAPLYYTSREPAIQVSSDANTASGLAMLISHIGQINTSTNTVVVSANGTFNVAINVSPNWPVGHHTIRAEEKISRRSAVLNFTIQQSEQTSTSAPTLSPTATSSPTGFPLPAGTPSPTATPSSTAAALGLSCATPASITLAANRGSNQSNSKQVTLCTSGSGLVNWTASWDHSKASWLQLDHSSGQIQAPGQGQVNVSAKANGLMPGKYTTTVTFSSQPGTSRVSLAVTFTVQATVQAPCVSAKPETLTFTGVVGNSDPQPQTVTVSNCGNTAGDWSRSTDANWLTVNPTGDTLSGGDTEQANIGVSLANLKVGAYNGDVTFTLGSSTVQVHVTLTVKQQTACIQANPQLLDLNSGSGNKITITNCGDAGTWSPSISTDDGSNWLGLHQTGGPLDGGVSQDVYTQLRDFGLTPGKTYTAHITFTITTNSGAQHSVTVVVKFTTCCATPSILGVMAQHSVTVDVKLTEA